MLLLTISWKKNVFLFNTKKELNLPLIFIITYFAIQRTKAIYTIYGKMEIVP